MAEVIRKAIVEIEYKVKSDDLKDSTDKAKTFGDVSKRSFAQAEKSADDAAKAASRVREANFQAAESFKSAAGGALTFARGYALMTISSEKDTKKFLEKFALIQGGIDALRGGAEVFLGVAKGVQFLQTASTAAAAAETARATATGAASVSSAAATTTATTQAASNVAVGVTARGAAAGLALMNAAMGPLGIAALALTAIIVGTATAVALLTQEEEKNRLEEEKAIRRRNQLADITNRVAFKGSEVRDLAGVAGGEGAQFLRQQRIQELQDLTAARASRRQFLEEERQRKAEGERITGGAADPKLLLGIQKDIAKETQFQITALQEEKRLRIDIATEQKRQHEDALRELETRKGIVDQTRQEAQAKRDAARALQGQQESLELRFGSLRGGERRIAERLLQKAKDGTLSETEARRLESLGLATSETRAARLRGARARGSESLIGGLSAGGGTFASETGRLRSEAAAGEEFARKESERIAEAERAHRESITNLSNRLVSTIHTLANQNIDLNNKLTDLESKIAATEERLGQ